jgi:hypothetical protein
MEAVCSSETSVTIYNFTDFRTQRTTSDIFPDVRISNLVQWSWGFETIIWIRNIQTTAKLNVPVQQMYRIYESEL